MSGQCSQGSIPQDSAASQEASTVCSNSTHLWERSAKRAISQGGNPSDNAASQKASTVHANSNPPWEDSANSTNSQGGNPPLPMQSTTLGLRQLGTQPDLGLPRQTLLFFRQIVRSHRYARPPPSTALLLRQLPVVVPNKQWLSPPLSNNITQAGSKLLRSFPRGNRHSARLRASQSSEGGTTTSQANSAIPKEAIIPLHITLGLTVPGSPF